MRLPAPSWTACLAVCAVHARRPCGYRLTGTVADRVSDVMKGHGMSTYGTVPFSESLNEYSQNLCLHAVTVVDMSTSARLVQAICERISQIPTCAFRWENGDWENLCVNLRNLRHAPWHHSTSMRAEYCGVRRLKHLASSVRATHLKNIRYVELGAQSIGHDARNHRCTYGLHLAIIIDNTHSSAMRSSRWYPWNDLSIVHCGLRGRQS